MFGFLITSTTPPRGRALLQDCYTAAVKHGLDCKVLKGYQPCDTLVLYGVGGADRYALSMRHVRRGGRLIMFDAGYWERKLPLTIRKYRVAINELHPQARVMEGQYPGPGRFNKSGLKIGSKHNPDGPIMLVGTSPKSQKVWAEGWTAQKAKEIRAAFPDKKILYRPKPKRPKERVDYDSLSVGHIDSELEKCSLVVCRHSNVSVDAARVGVPVVCEDGAARAIYPGTFDRVHDQPTIETRTEFLHRLAYWQWSRREMGKFWEWYEAQ